MIKRCLNSLFDGIHPASLGLFRIIVGILLFVQFYRLEEYIVEVLPQSEYLVSYDFFDWLPLMDPAGLKALFLSMKVLSILLVLGVFYRIVVGILFLGWSYVFLVDAGHYNNHYYLLSLLLFLMIFIEGDAWGSIQHLFKFKPVKHIPKWNLWILRFQVVIMYFFGGIAKMNADWMQGYPLRFWLDEKHIAGWFDQMIHSEFGVYFLAWGGLVLDLSVGFLLLWNKYTRWLAIIPLLIFHISNHFLWDIGIFPFFAISTTLLFYPPEIVAKRIRSTNEIVTNVISKKRWIPYFLGTYVFIQVLVPLRQFAFGSTPQWDGIGDSFSWRMMLTDRANAVRIKVVIPSQQMAGFIEFDQYINHRQFKRLLNIPKHVWKFAHHIAKTMKDNGAPDDIEIYAYVYKSVNGRSYQLLTDTTYNLVAEPFSVFKEPPYILPFHDNPILADNLYEMDLLEFQTKFAN